MFPSSKSLIVLLCGSDVSAETSSVPTYFLLNGAPLRSAVSPAAQSNLPAAWRLVDVKVDKEGAGFSYYLQLVQVEEPFHTLKFG